MSESDKSGKPELTAEDTKRIEDKSHMTYPNDSIWRGFDVSIGFRSAFRIGAEYATLHERSAAQARIAELEVISKALIKTLQVSLPIVSAPLRETFEIAIAKAKDKLLKP